MGLAWVTGVMRVPWLAAIGVILILGVVSIPAASLQLSLPSNGSEPKGSTQRIAYDRVAEGFGEGFSAPLVVAIDITQSTDFMDEMEEIRQDLAKLDGVDYVSEGLPDATLDTGILQVVPESAPDSPQTTALVQEIRDRAPTIKNKYDMQIWVTGTTAVQIDISKGSRALLSLVEMSICTAVVPVTKISMSYSS